MRARWLKPEFFTDKKIGPLGMAAALVFEALWCVADDGGAAECEPVLLKGQMFMRWEEITVDAIETALTALAAAGLIQRYGSGDREFALIKSWKKNQPVHNPSQFRHPRPQQQVTESAANGLPQDSGRGEAVGSPSSHPIYLDSSTPQHPESSTPDTPARARANGEDKELRRQFKVILDAYPQRPGDSPRDGYLAFLERVRQGATPAEILEGVRRYAAYCVATDKIGTDFVKQLRTFLGKSRYYLEPWNLPRAAGANSQSRRNAGEESYERGKRALQDINR
jgi:hypothetical protein